jgi:hypothetical protein
MRCINHTSADGNASGRHVNFIANTDKGLGYIFNVSIAKIKCRCTP